MRRFEIIDGAKRSAKPCAVLEYDVENDKLAIDIADWASERDVPMLFMPFIRKGERRINDTWARRWVNERVVPSGRQNLGQVLRANGLQFYDAIALLIAGEGRCSQDDFYIREKPVALPKADGVSKQAGKLIRQAREQENLSQAKLAEKCGIRQSALSRLENGKGNPTISLLEDIAQSLGKKLEIRLV